MLICEMPIENGPENQSKWYWRWRLGLSKGQNMQILSGPVIEEDLPLPRCGIRASALSSSLIKIWHWFHCLYSLSLSFSLSLFLSQRDGGAQELTEVKRSHLSYNHFPSAPQWNVFSGSGPGKRSSSLVPWLTVAPLQKFVSLKLDKSWIHYRRTVTTRGLKMSVINVERFLLNYLGCLSSQEISRRLS